MKVPEKPMDVFDELRDDIAWGTIGAVAVTLVLVGLSWLVVEFL